MVEELLGEDEPVDHSSHVDYNYSHSIGNVNQAFITDVI